MSLTLKAYQAPEHQPFLWRGHHTAAALLIHGFPGTPAEMRPAAQALHSAGLTVQGLLLPGFGETTFSASQETTLPQVANDNNLLTVIASLQDGRQTFYIDSISQQHLDKLIFEIQKSQICDNYPNFLSIIF